MRRLGLHLRARQRDVLLRRTRLRALGIERGAGLLHGVLLIGPVQPDDDLSPLHGRVRIDQDGGDAFLDLARHRDRVGVDLGVVGRLVRGRVREVPDAPDQRCDHHDRAQHEHPNRRPPARGRGRGFVLDGLDRPAADAAALDDRAARLRRRLGCGSRSAETPTKKTSTIASIVAVSGTTLSQSLRPTTHEKNIPMK